MSNFLFRFPPDALPDSVPNTAVRPASHVVLQGAVPPHRSPPASVRIYDPVTNIYVHDIVDMVTGPLGLTLIHARVSPEQTTRLQLPIDGLNGDIILASDVADRDGGIVSIEVTDETRFFLGPDSNPICLCGADGVAAVRDALDRDAIRLRRGLT